MVFESLASDLIPDDRNHDRGVFVARITPSDIDQDGLDDGWEVRHFDSRTADANSDSDSDGSSNLQEYRAGTDQRDSQSQSRLAVATSAGDPSTLILNWSGSIGMHYDLLFSQTLDPQTWTVLDRVTALSERITVPVPATLGGFYLVRAVEKFGAKRQPSIALRVAPSGYNVFEYANSCGVDSNSAARSRRLVFFGQPGKP